MSNSKLKDLNELRRNYDKRVAQQRMKLFGGNVSAVARSLGVTRDTVYKILSSN